MEKKHILFQSLEVSVGSAITHHLEKQNIIVAKTEHQKLVDKLWDECKRIVRARYIKEDGTWDCFTCGRRIDVPAKAQTGHCIPSGACGAYLRYDFRNLRIQCYNCNINQGGAGAAYYRNLVLENGQEYVDQLFQDKFKTVKADKWWYLEKIANYKEILK